MALVHVVLCVAVVATLLLSYSSLRELSVIVDQQQRRAPLEERSQLTSGNDFVHVAERAIGHIEHLPQLGHHGQSEETTDITGEDKLAASDVPEERVHGASLDAEITNLPRKQSDVATSAGSGVCQMIEHTDYWGEALIWGPFNKKASAEECCKACTDYKPPTENDAYCNVWVWCGDKEACGEQYQDCWVKFLLHPVASKPKVGPQVPWTSGLMANDRVDKPTPPSPEDDRRFHIVTTAQGTPVHWQVRIHYYWYLKQKEVCEAAGGCMMGGFTRLLHSGAPDDLMDEIPTAVVDPLPPSVPGANQGYVVLNRPWAILQWMEKANIKEKYILMSEPDHVFLHPLINFMHKDNPAAFPFFYIEPARKDFAPITQKFLGPLSRKQLESIAPMGNSPTMLRTADLKALAPHWYNLSISIFNDPVANKEWGWVMEMYAFTLACFKVGLKVDLRLEMMAQPPWDMELEERSGVPFYILHYTYGMDYTLAGEFTPGKFGEWRFDKRSYAMKPPPRHLSDPPDGMHNDLVRALIRMINEATDAIPGWDQYSITGTVHS